MKPEPCTLPTLAGDELAGVTGGAARIAAAAGSIDPTTLDLMFSQIQSSVKNIANAQQNGAGNMLPLVAMAAAMRNNQAPAAPAPMVIPIPVGGGWHHHHHRCR
jgi:hypothetical protein